ncbi:MAG: hypothetical protein FWG05_02240 [Kiritimatiellaeota bacterium]|nr:hypothetical protein [Kiritimatiellota bacterium]
MSAKPTPRENMLRTLRRQGFDWAPVDSGGFCPSQIEAFQKRFGHTRIAEFFNTPYRGVGINLKPAFTDGRALYPNETLPERVDFDVFGVAHSHQEGCWHMTRMHHPLKGDPTIAQIMGHPLPTIAPGALESLTRDVAAIQARGLAVKGTYAMTVWELAWYLRSMEDLMGDMMSGDERATVHFDRITALACDVVREYARAGVDIIELGDDIGMQNTIMMSVELWREWIKPRLAKIIASARDAKPDILIYYHSCGYVMPFIDELIEVGVDILQPVQPECMDFADVHAAFGERMSFWSTIGTQHVLPFGTPDEVRGTVLRNLRICGAKGGIVIGPTHLVEPEVPWENLVAMKEAAEAFKL